MWMYASNTEGFIESFLMLVTKAVGSFVHLKDTNALQQELKHDYIITKELSTVAGSLMLRCGGLLSMANTALISSSSPAEHQASTIQLSYH